jgi:predicted DsbA family dithiol-disulfide isomerase
VADVAPVSVTFFTDPYSPWCWAAEPQLRRLQVEFGDGLEFTFVIVGLHRTIGPAQARALALACLDAGEASGMPVDPRVFLRDPPASTHPAGLAVAAVSEQGDPARFLRRLREAILLEGRRMDSAPALLDAAREAGGLDLERLKVDFASNAIVERFAADLERGRDVEVPAYAFADGGAVSAREPYEAVRAAALAAGAQAAGGPRPGVEEAVARFGPLTTPEVAAVCDLPGPRAPAELWRLAVEWRLRPRPVLGGHLWQAA